MRWPAFLLLLAGCVQQSSPPARLGPEAVTGPEDPLPADGVDVAPAMIHPAVTQPVPPPPLTVKGQLLRTPDQASSIGTVRQVTVRFELIGAGAPSVAAVEFIAPDGTPYERQEQVLVGTPYDSRTLEHSLQVAGTLIETAKLSGVWETRLFVDGNPVQRLSFGLTP